LISKIDSFISDGVLSDASGSVVVKPCTTAEVAFYESASSHPDFAAYMPTYMGTLKMSSAACADEAAAASSQSVGNAAALGTASSLAPDDPGPMRGKKLETGLSIVLENIASPFKKPNILDVKLGAQLWDDGASLQKRERLDKVAAGTTSKSLGFRIAGMKVWQGEDKRNDPLVDATGYRVYNKFYGREFSADNVIEGFREFLFVPTAGIDNDLGRAIASTFLKQVQGIQKALEAQETRMYSASILFVYEGDAEALREALEEEPSRASSTVQADRDDQDDDDEEEDRRKAFAVKLIDFAHATWTPGLGPDENALQGVRSTAKILRDLARG
jgi:inositol-polyphosphate multikinase